MTGLAENDQKHCTKCGKLTPISGFRKDAKGKRGYRSICKVCDRADVTSEQRAKWRKAYQQKHPIKSHLIRASSRARTKGFEFTITEEYLTQLWETQQGKCYWFGVDMTVGINDNDPLQMSLDRLDNYSGYVPGNVVWCCQFANLGRSTTDAKTFREVVDKLKGSC